MPERWYKEAVIYCLDVETFQDSNDDGVGDLQGLISRLDYLLRLGVTGLWLNPIGGAPGVGDDLHGVFSDRGYPPPTPALEGLKLGGYGYRWIRLCHNLVDRSAHATARGA